MLGGKVPSASPATDGAYFVQPTICANVRSDMRHRSGRDIRARHVGVQVERRPTDSAGDNTPYGMTAAIYSRSLFTAHLTASEVQAVFVWGS